METDASTTIYSVRDVIYLYKINKSINLANKSVDIDYFDNDKITFRKYITGMYEILQYITKYTSGLTKLEHLQDINEIISEYNRITEIRKSINGILNIEQKNIFIAILDDLNELSDIIISKENISFICNNIVSDIFKFIIEEAISYLISKNITIDNISYDDNLDLFDILNNDDNDNDNDNLILRILFKNINILLNTNEIEKLNSEFKSIEKLNNEIDKLPNCKYKLIAIYKRDAYISKTSFTSELIKYLEGKINIIDTINELNQFKEIDTISNYNYTSNNYNETYISYCRTIETITYNPGKKITNDIPINYLMYYSDSCYMDVIIFSLLYKNNKFILKKILKKSFEKYYLFSEKINNGLETFYNKLTNELDSIYNYIHDKKKQVILNVGDSASRDKLRNILNDIHKIFIDNKYYYLISNKQKAELFTVSTDQLIDANSSPQYELNNFVIILFTIFQLNDLITIKKSDGTYNDIMLNIPNNNKFILPDLFKDNDDNNITIVKSNLLVLSNKLNYIQDKNKYAKLIPPPYLKLKFNKKLIYLQSIIIHYPNIDKGHYKCLFNNNSIWYMYDDKEVTNDKPYIPIGTLDDIIENPIYNEYITMLIYY
jgi:hypothetical protein